MSSVPPLGSVYVDTTVLSNFASSGAVEPLVRFDAEFYVVEPVRDELRDGVDAGHDELADVLDRLHRLTPDLDKELWHRGALLTLLGSPYADRAHETSHEFIQRLDAGEAHTLYAAWNRGATIATDDQDARRLADEYGVEVTGSIGLLARGVVTGAFTVDEANGHLETWVEKNGYYSPIDDVREVLDDDVP